MRIQTRLAAAVLCLAAAALLGTPKAASASPFMCDPEEKARCEAMESSCRSGCNPEVPAQYAECMSTCDCYIAACLYGINCSDQNCLPN
jgi:hypothetical protein